MPGIVSGGTGDSSSTRLLLTPPAVAAPAAGKDAISK